VLYPPSGVRLPVLDPPELGLESVCADLRLLASPYIDTDRRIEGNRGKWDWTTAGSMVNSIDCLLRVVNSAAKGLFVVMLVGSF
jgi:hypothetical protein